MAYCFIDPADPGSRMVMSHSAAASFLDLGRVFDRREYAATVGREPDDPAVDTMLAGHVQAGEIKHVAEGIFGTIPPGPGDPDRYPVDPYLVAGRLRPGAVLAYHSALDIHGCAYHITHCVVHAFSPAGREEMVIDGVFYDFFDPAPGIILGGERLGDGIEIVTLMGVDVRVTTPERTMADLFDRPVLGGDGLVESIDGTDGLDGAALVRHIRPLGNAAAAGAMGFWLESRRDEHRVDDAVLEDLRALAPREPRYALGAHPDGRYGGNTFVEGWNVFLPRRFVVPEIHGDPLWEV